MLHLKDLTRCGLVWFGVVGPIVIALLSTAQAKVAPATLAMMVETSTYIVVADVTNVSEDRDGYWWATAHVREVWKGSPTEEIRFLASATWTCDTSGAVKGERVVLFLREAANRQWSKRATRFFRMSRLKAGSSLLIAHSGRGRMPIRVVNGEEYATYWSDAILPASVSVVEAPSRSIPSFGRPA